MSDTQHLPFPQDVLLEHRAWVRALARSLVRDPADADDLEQDTWVRALRSMPRDARSPRAWLGTVLRNRFRDRLRTRERRAGREQAVASDGVHPPAADIAASAEIHRGVLDAVLALEPPFRDVVLLRYFEGLSPADIAERQGIPAATVRTRLHRGLARLREILDAGHGNDGARWKAALAPLLVVPARPFLSEPPRRPWKVPLAIGVGAVTAALLVVFAVQVWSAKPARLRVATAVAVGAKPSWDEDPNDAAIRRERERVTEPFRQDAAAAPSPRDEGVPTEPAEDEGDRIRVAVVDAAGTAVAGARVQLVNGDSLAKSGFGRLLAESTSAEDGSASLAPSGATGMRLVARHEGRAGITPVLERDAALGGEVRVRLGAASSLHGVLVATDGSGIPGARVALMLTGDVFGPGGVAFTDKEGRFSFAPLPHDAFETPANLEIVATGFPHTNHPATRADMTGPGMRIELAAAVTLTGRCVDAEGEPISAVWVSCSHAVRPMETGADGRFSVVGVDRARADGRAISLSFECDTHAPRRIELDDIALDAGDQGDVVLDVGHTMRGRVVDTEGRPVPRASVFAEGLETRQIARQGQTDDEGRFVFEHVADEPHEVVASGPADDAFSGLTGVVENVRPGDDEVVVRISAALTVLVELIDRATGEPLTLTNVLVFIEPLDGDEDDDAGSGVSSDDGFQTVRVRAKRAGAYKLTVRSFDGWGEVVVDRIVISEDAETRVQAKLRRE